MNTTNLEDRIALHAWTLDTTPLADVLRIVRETGYAGIELRYDDYKRALESGRTREQYLDDVRSSGVKVTVMGVENGLIFAEGAEHEQLLESFRVSCTNARDLACDTLMISAGRNAPTTVTHAAMNFRRACDIAGEYGLKLALEFNSRHPMVNSTAVAREIVHGARMDNGGLLLDVYHLHSVGATGRGFEEVPVEEIFAFQFSDVPPGPPSKGATAVDRLPPGRGAVDWTGVFALLMEKGYTGYMSYEAPNPAQWSRPAREVATEGLTAAKALIAAARKAMQAR